MNAQANLQESQQEEEHYYHRDIETTYLVEAKWYDKLLHAPFDFIGKHLFIGIALILAVIVSFFIAIPFYLLAIGFGVVGFIFSKLMKVETPKPPYFLSYKHADTYGYADWWEIAEEDLNYGEELREKHEQNLSDEAESSSFNLRSATSKVTDVAEKVNSVASLLTGGAVDFGDLLDTVGEFTGEGESSSKHQQQGNYAEGEAEGEVIPKPQPLSLEKRQELYNSSMKDFSTMLGLNEVKAEVRNVILEIKANRKLEKQGITPEKPTMHMIFSGPPGTGKTVTARLIAQILQATGYLETGQLVEASRSDLVAAYQGQTAINVKAKFEEARGGVLFIDEAYALKSGNDDSFGQEAIDTIIPLMENYRKEMVVILAGYEADMNKLMKTNSGFTSRIAYKFRFTDYTPDQLTDLTMITIEKRGYTATELKPLIQKGIKSKARNGVVDGNGRWVRNFVDKIEKQHKIMVANNEITDGRYIHANAIEKAIKQMK